MSETSDQDVEELLSSLVDGAGQWPVGGGASDHHLNPERVPYLISAIFGVPKGAPWPPPSLDLSMTEALVEATDSVLVTLSPREEKVIKLRFGLEKDGRPLTQKEVAKHFAVSVGRMRQIEGKARRTLGRGAPARRPLSWFPSLKHCASSRPRSSAA